VAYPRRLTNPAARKATTPRSSTRTKSAVGAPRKKARPAPKIAAPKKAAPKRVTPKRAAPKGAERLRKKALEGIKARFRKAARPAARGAYGIKMGGQPAATEARLRKQREVDGIPIPTFPPTAAGRPTRTWASKKRSAKSAATELSRKRKSAADLQRKRAAQRRRRRTA
jgi:hypothetical protein